MVDSPLMRRISSNYAEIQRSRTSRYVCLFCRKSRSVRHHPPLLIHNATAACRSCGVDACVALYDGDDEDRLRTDDGATWSLDQAHAELFGAETVYRSPAIATPG